MALALKKIVKIVRKINQETQKYNVCFIMVQVTGFIVTLGVQLGGGSNFIVAVCQGDLTDYQPIRNAVINDTVGFVANLFNFMVIATVIYKSLNVADDDDDDGDLYL